MSKIYVITGSASGIGKALTERLYDDNIVFAGYRNPEHESYLRGVSKNIFPFYIDYTKPETIEKAAEYINANCSHIDTLVNVAGCVVAGPIEKINITELKRQFDVNVFGHVSLTQKLTEKLVNGKIINISSMASFGIFPFISPYCASKRALDILFNSLLLENRKNIKVISIKPGVISTPLWSKSIDENSKYFSEYDEYQKAMEYMARNAEKNECNGLSVEKVVDIILKADRAKNPKLSYTVGFDAFCAKYASKLPQCIINKIIKLGMRMRMK